ncbi:Putative FtsH protease [Heterostelium album PN500]|uniref:FtsH protease n=1 Tax=Heterostelium pallidum (strain ATCC 26659 / Pp 5 / PN500) TaxID=670386 RepID=D3BAR8_HETP5|nr:Putative FtsH protease [Heterostelium album PN500]EFA81655.1 Putative FtsH protease [Heterostelium album PN500]|eukprot:XP_020433772.1 Putative FtsH protease [Heterostelium album PN500]
MSRNSLLSLTRCYRQHHLNTSNAAAGVSSLIKSNISSLSNNVNSELKLNQYFKNGGLASSLIKEEQQQQTDRLVQNNTTLRSYSQINKAQQQKQQQQQQTNVDILAKQSTPLRWVPIKSSSQLFALNNHFIKSNIDYQVRLISTKKKGSTVKKDSYDYGNGKSDGNQTKGFLSLPQPLEVKVQGNTSPLKIFVIMLITASVVYYFYFNQTNPGASGSSNSSGILSVITSKPYKKVLQRPKETFDDVIGADEAKSELQDLVDYLRNPNKYIDRNIVIPKGILLVGPPGTGKTLLAKALAGEARIPFLTINGSEFEEMFIGVGAKRVRDLFETARKNAPCIVFIDEIDSVGGSRSKRVNYHPSEALNQLLVELDGFNGREGVVVIAATNYQETLDAALVRSGRFDRSIQVPLPDCKSRKQIIELYLKNKKFSTGVNTQIIAQGTPGFSGADLFNLVNWAALDTTRNDRPEISMESLENAKENIIMGKERHSLILSDEARRICAYHEAGHALVALFTEGSKDVHKATIMPRGDALGLVSMLQKDDFFQTKKQYLAEMDVAMGGRAAEELVLGVDNISQGASSDIKKATSIAKSMVMKLGMSDKVGKIYIDSEKKLSVQQRELVDSEVKAYLDQSFERACELLKKHSKEHHLLAEALLEYETLNLEEIKSIINKKPLVNKKNRSELLKEREEKEKKRQEEFKKKDTTQPMPKSNIIVIPQSNNPTPSTNNPGRLSISISRPGTSQQQQSNNNVNNNNNNNNNNNEQQSSSNNTKPSEGKNITITDANNKSDINNK